MAEIRRQLSPVDEAWQRKWTFPFEDRATLTANAGNAADVCRHHSEWARDGLPAGRVEEPPRTRSHRTCDLLVAPL